jgi:chloramphenicol-sensitive protein RarD
MIDDALPAARSARVPEDRDSRRGFLFALAAYLMWGFLPLFMKAVAHIPTAEVIAHRVIWSLPIAGAVIAATGASGAIRRALVSPRMLAMAAATALLLSVNWGLYVWAIGSGHALDAALGYYINPLFSVFLGWLLLGERLARGQVAALALAAAAVAVLTWDAGRLPLVALGLTVTWGFYAYLKKSLPIGANEGFFLEVLLLLPPALGYALWLGAAGPAHFLAGSAWDTGLLLACGLVTAVPLMVYANGAKGLRLSTIAMMQYIAPTMILLTAVFLFREPLGTARMVAFPMIWAALGLYTLAGRRPSQRAPAGRER